MKKPEENIEDLQRFNAKADKMAPSRYGTGC
jgi:hypothetical protein